MLIPPPVALFIVAIISLYVVFKILKTIFNIIIWAIKTIRADKYRKTLADQGFDMSELDDDAILKGVWLYNEINIKAGVKNYEYPFPKKVTD